MGSPGRPVGTPNDNYDLSPRVKTALRLYQTGVCPTQREASESAGLHPAYLTWVLNKSDDAKRLASQVDEKLEHSLLNASKLIESLGRKALLKINKLMDDAGKEEVQLRAAIDLADRSPETQKTQRHEITALTLDSQDVKLLAEAMVQSAEVKERYSQAVQGDFIPQAEDVPMEKAS